MKFHRRLTEAECIGDEFVRSSSEIIMRILLSRRESSLRPACGTRKPSAVAEFADDLPDLQRCREKAADTLVVDQLCEEHALFGKRC